MVADGDFRQDLMYRINTFEIQLPPLRDRLDDIAELAHHLLGRHRPEAAPENRPLNFAFDESAIKLLQSHNWPGNIRELANVVEHASILCDRLPISAGDLPQHFGSVSASGPALAASGKSLREMEMDTIHATLEKLNGNKTAAAQQLGISLKTLYNKLNSEVIKKAA
jgi:two-component system NtrC family response regulator